MRKIYKSNVERIKKQNAEYVRKLQILMAHRLRRLNKRIV